MVLGLPCFSYCKRQKLGGGLGTRLESTAGWEAEESKMPSISIPMSIGSGTGGGGGGGGGGVM